MPEANINHEGYQRRLDTIQKILATYGLESTSVTTVEYVDNGPFPYNNFIYKIDLVKPATPSTFADKPQRPGTTAPPESGISTLILRVSNPHAMDLNNENRVQNDVAAQHLFRKHLADAHPSLVHVVPAVYAWEPCRYPQVADESGFAWTMCEFISGANLDRQFREMDIDGKLAVVEQMADIFAAFQGIPLPASLKTHVGGLTFGEDGQIIGGQMPIIPPGPWENYADMWVARLLQAFSGAEKSSALLGWSSGGVGARLKNFIQAGGVPKLLQSVDTSKRVLIHGDLTMNNVLFDPTTKRITALLDYDWAAVTHPVHEFHTGLTDLNGGTHPEDQKLQQAIFRGDFDSSNATLSDEEKVDWQVAKAWDSSLAARGAIRPSQIRGVEDLEKLRKLEELICPFMLSAEFILARRTPEQIQKLKKNAEAELVELLDSLGA